MRIDEAIAKAETVRYAPLCAAFDLCVKRRESRPDVELDLRRWTTAFNGAEPIRPASLERFAAAFAPHGFHPDAFLPSYGLAEATLLVSGRRGLHLRSFLASDLERGCATSAQADDPEGRRLVSCGAGAAGQQVVIVDP
ncbi:MAG: hypothetical protein MUF54_22190 [Polyangiaceae bacterium]|nr:hypothetical protein [Polyangiaceae bacterium]